MSWGLTKEEQERLDGEHFGGEGDSPMRELVPAVAQATLRHVCEEGESTCLNPQHYDTGILPMITRFLRRRFDCLKCREELKREAGID